MTVSIVVRCWVVWSLVAPVAQLDEWARDAVQRSRRPELEAIMRGATDIGRPQFVLGAMLAVAAFGGAAGPTIARVALVALVPTNLVVEVTKRAVQRPRPDGERKRSNASFPSSHAANAAALAVVLSRRWPRLGLVFWGLAALVSWSRIYLNRHFLSDVLVGVLVGVGCAWLAIHWFRSRGSDIRPGTARGAFEA